MHLNKKPLFRKLLILTTARIAAIINTTEAVIHSAVVIMVYLQIPIVGPEVLLLFAHNQNISVRPVPLHVESH